MHAELLTDADAAAAQAEQYRQHADVNALDHDGELRRRLADVRRAVAGRIAGGDPQSTAGVDALRAALTATFEKVQVWTDPDGGVYLLPFVRQEAMDEAAWEQDESVRPRRIPLQFQEEQTTGTATFPPWLRETRRGRRSSAYW